MSLVYEIIFIITAAITVIYDYKYQKIPVIAILYNYSVICLLVNPGLLVGVLIIVVCYIYKEPIDLLYLLLLAYMIVISNNAFYNILAIIPLLAYILLDNRKNISFMVPIEVSYSILLLKDVL